MPLHRLNHVTIGVPDVEKTADFYRDFNLSETAPGRFATADGGDQLRLVKTPIRRLVEISVGADDPDDVSRVASQLAKLDVAADIADDSVSAVDRGSGVRVTVAVAPRIEQAPSPAPKYNGPANRPRGQVAAPSSGRRAGPSTSP
jgi:catechol 2,3-dioxygenase-like lactoylglutathione lyase family enzyme